MESAFVHAELLSLLHDKDTECVDLINLCNSSAKIKRVCVAHPWFSGTVNNTFSDFQKSCISKTIVNNFINSCSKDILFLKLWKRNTWNQPSPPSSPDLLSEKIKIKWEILKV